MLRLNTTHGAGTANGGNLLGDKPPPIPLGPCVPDAAVAARWPEYGLAVRSVRALPPCTTCKDPTADERKACARWWHATPQREYTDLPLRTWSGVLRSTNWTAPPCSFGQASRTEHKCAASHRQLVAALDALRVVYFPRSGTELGLVRDGQLLGTDGDLDIHVDMPQTMLHAQLKPLLTPPPHLEGSGVTAEVHWAVPGCPEAHLVYNDWISDELRHRATPADLCACRLNSVEMLCHRDGVQRMYTQYGPSWKVPLGFKQLDMPGWAASHRAHKWIQSMRAMLSGMVIQNTGWIEADAVEALMPKRSTAPVDPLILAQLNVLYRSI